MNPWSMIFSGVLLVAGSITMQILATKRLTPHGLFGSHALFVLHNMTSFLVMSAGAFLIAHGIRALQ